MTVAPEQLREHYASMEMEDLVDLYRRSDLTELALSEFKEVVNPKGVSWNELCARVTEEEAREFQVIFQPVFAKPPRIRIGYAIAAAFFAYGIAEVIVDPSGGNKVSPILVVIGLVGWGYWLVCVHRIHWILAEATGGQYPISPAEGAGFNLIPVFGFYWIFRWPNEIARFLNGRWKRK